MMGTPPVIAAADTDDNGTLSKSEFEALASKFDELDSNGDGEIDMPELMMSKEARDRMQQFRDRGGFGGMRGNRGDRGGRPGMEGDRGGRPPEGRGDRGGRGPEGRGGRPAFDNDK